ncbi:DUF2288 domain-containing protein [Pseudomonas sp. RIT-PI-AD]|uniref:DUF2288 domain-containing protein n=1 Tax=Pseudomonas sp. RIT-PI-AD TaxID=3035294 RepID=UPI0021D9D6A7|nr:DUF2288 domain-containing protein [Pseudomonas sp. RIT-PI-AD]
MSDQAELLYAKLLGETAPIRWQELQPFFARGALLWVDSQRDLLAIATAVAADDRAEVARWLEEGSLLKVDERQAQDLFQRDPTLWAVVVAPWVLIQERSAVDTNDAAQVPPAASR